MACCQFPIEWFQGYGDTEMFITATRTASSDRTFLAAPAITLYGRLQRFSNSCQITADMLAQQSWAGPTSLSEILSKRSCSHHFPFDWQRCEYRYLCLYITESTCNCMLGWYKINITYIFNKIFILYLQGSPSLTFRAFQFQEK